MVSWEVTAATLALRATYGAQAATMELFAPAQGFFGVATPAQVAVQVCPASARLLALRSYCRRLHQHQSAGTHSLWRSPALPMPQVSPSDAGLLCTYSLDGLYVSCLASQAASYIVLMRRAST